LTVERALLFIILYDYYLYAVSFLNETHMFNDFSLSAVIIDQVHHCMNPWAYLTFFGWWLTCCF
jgi:hypothetical protein